MSEVTFSDTGIRQLFQILSSASASSPHLILLAIGDVAFVDLCHKIESADFQISTLTEPETSSKVNLMAALGRLYDLDNRIVPHGKWGRNWDGLIDMMTHLDLISSNNGFVLAISHGDSFLSDEIESVRDTGLSVMSDIAMLHMDAEQRSIVPVEVKPFHVLFQIKSRDSVFVDKIESNDIKYQIIDL